MTHIISHYQTPATVVTGKYIATIGISSQGDWQPYDGSKPAVGKDDVGYLTCERTDITVEGQTFTGSPTALQRFTVGKLIPIDDIGNYIDLNTFDKKDIGAWKARGITRIVLLHDAFFMPYVDELYKHEDPTAFVFGTVVSEDTIHRIGEGK